MKDSFTDRELLDLAGSGNFTWNWLSPKGDLVVSLMGVDQTTLELEEFSVDFCIVMTIRDRRSNFRWVMATVYGPVDHDLSSVFLEELSVICNQAILLIILGGDFNLIREESDKNSDNVNYHLMDLFNEFTGINQLRELKRSGQRFS